MSKTACNQLRLVWKDPQSRRNYQIGSLERSNSGFTFEYGYEYQQAQANTEWELLKAFPEEKKYKSDTLFTAFANRLPDPKRRDIKHVLEKYNLTEYDGFDILRASYGRLPIDSYEFIDPIFPDDETITRKFYVAGVRHKAPCDSRECSNLPDMAYGDELSLVCDPDNIADESAILIYKDDCCLGFVPRYYSEQVTRRLKRGMTYSCRITEVNNVGDCSNCIQVELRMPKKEY